MQAWKVNKTLTSSPFETWSDGQTQSTNKKMCIKSKRETCKMAPKIGRKQKPKSRPSCGKPGRIWSFWPLHLLSIYYCPRFRWGVNRLAEGCFSNGWQFYTLFIILCFHTWSLSCERMTTPCWSTRFWICSSRLPCASSQSQTYYEYFSPWKI